MRLLVLCPHFEPDTAPTGTVMTRLVHELAARGHELHVVTALPWYREHRVEPAWTGRLLRRETTPFGSVTRVHPFAGRDRSGVARSGVARRALGFVAFCLLAGIGSLRSGRWRMDGVLVMSPPLPLGVVGWAVRLLRGGPLVFNVQDVHPDGAVRTGAVTNRTLISLASWLERFTYHRSHAVTVLSDDLAANVRAKMRAGRRHRVVVIPNFADVEAIVPADRATAYRRELGIGDEPVVMYAGNVGISQSLDLMLAAARALPEVTFVINGNGSARADLERRAQGIANLRFGAFQPAERLSEVLATADLHVVPLRAGLGAVSVPSKTYSILAAARPILAAIDDGTEVPRILAAAGAGRNVAPDEPVLFVDAVRELLAEPAVLADLGRSGRRWVEAHVSPAAVAQRYEALFSGQAGPDPLDAPTSR